jgi:NCS1 family nucleobase:cation symporter-1
MWMSDVHSVGGYVFAASLFATGLTGWQVLTGMLVGILVANWLINLVGRPSQRLGVPYPVAARIAFGVFGANLPALVRAAVAIVWYGVQTYFASVSLMVLVLKLFPGLVVFASRDTGFAGLSGLGWAAYLTTWALQLAIFYRGMDSIRRFVDFAGPAVYVVMFALAAWVYSRVGVANIDLSLADRHLSGREAWLETGKVAALVVGYFSAFLLSFGDFSRYCPSERQMVLGNLLGLPVNWMLFAVVTVVITSGTVSIFGELIMDPLEVVHRLDSVAAVTLASLTFIIATLGINLVANFVAPAFDLANLAPRKISFRTGGLISAGFALFSLPWQFVESPQAIAIFVGTIGGFLGPIYAIMVTDYYLVKRQEVAPDDLFNATPDGSLWYSNGWNLRALLALAPGVVVSGIISFTPFLSPLVAVSWFVAAAISGALYLFLNRMS